MCSSKASASVANQARMRRHLTVTVAVAAAQVLAAAGARAQAPGTRPDVPRLTLTDAIQRALTQNPRVLVQLEELERAQAQVRQVRAAALPTLTGNGVYTRIDGPRVLTADNMPPQTLQGADAFTANISARAPLLAPQAWVQWSHARGNVRVS